MKLQDMIAGWMKEKVTEAGAEGIVFGLSGGIDSAVVGALAKKACGDNVLGLILPCNSLKADEADARLVAGKLGIKTLKVDLGKVHACFMQALHEGNDMAEANLKPRLRMCTLYYYANMMNYLVSGTGNRSELMMGYYTKHGDGGADMLPIADLLKTEVRELAVKLGVPAKIIKKAPSAGLWEGQTDEEEMGISYRELDAVLASMSTGAKAKVSRGSSKKVKDKIKISGHKRQMAPIFIKKDKK